MTLTYFQGTEEDLKTNIDNNTVFWARFGEQWDYDSDDETANIRWSKPVVAKVDLLEKGTRDEGTRGIRCNDLKFEHNTGYRNMWCRYEGSEHYMQLLVKCPEK